MHFDIIGYTGTDTRRVIIKEVESIKRIRILYDAYINLLGYGLLHPDIKRLKCYIVDYEKILDITETISDGYNVYPKYPYKQVDD